MLCVGVCVGKGGGGRGLSGRIKKLKEIKMTSFCLLNKIIFLSNEYIIRP